LENGHRLDTFCRNFGPQLANLLQIPEKAIQIGTQNGHDCWVVLLRRKAPENARILTLIPKTHHDLTVRVDYTSTVKQRLIQADEQIHGVPSFSTRGRMTNSNKGTVGFISSDSTGTAIHHVVDNGNGTLSDIFDSGGVKVADTIHGDAVLDTAVVQYCVTVQPTHGGTRPPIRGELVRKARSKQSGPSDGVIFSVSETSVRVVGVNNAHSGDSGQICTAVSDGASVCIHQEGHDWSQGSAQGARINNTCFPGLGPSL
jgi:hypothetical protein